MQNSLTHEKGNETPSVPVGFARSAVSFARAFRFRPFVAVPGSPAAITLAWLIRLRWGAVLGQTATLCIARLVLGIALPLAPLFVLVSSTVVSNVALALWLRRVEDVAPTTMGLLLGADTLMLTGLLYFSGGPSNPFSTLYLVHVTLAALVLGMRWAMAIVVVSAASYAGLFFSHVPLAGMAHAHHSAAPSSVHLQGMWVALTVAACLIAYFVSRLAAALRTREADLARAQTVAARTFAVASGELERSIRRDPIAALEDARLIRAEVERCRAIVAADKCSRRKYDGRGS